MTKVRRPPGQASLGGASLDDIDAATLHILHKSSIGSARSIAQLPKIAHSPVRYQLHESLASQSFHLRWAPHVMI
jgi:hypothetical protein